MSRLSICVLIPVKTPAPWLEEAVCSALRQAPLPPQEVLVVFDGAPGPHELGVVSISPLVRHVSIQGGRGLSHVLNVGLANTDCDLVARLDADDRCKAHRIVAQVRRFEVDPSLAVLGSSADFIDRDGVYLGRHRVATGPRLVSRLLWRNSIVHPSVMMRREMVVGAGGYNESVWSGEDYELWLRLVGKYRIDNVAAPLVDYRLHMNQMSTKRMSAESISGIAAARNAAHEALGYNGASSWVKQRLWVMAQSRSRPGSAWSIPWIR